jgi:hypothetical protein
MIFYLTAGVSDPEEKGMQYAPKYQKSDVGFVVDFFLTRKVFQGFLPE